ncbi:MAG TPA: hypothetical protein VIL50_05475, partial [Candidatus Limnocylindrales bacterium]
HHGRPERQLKRPALALAAQQRLTWAGHAWHAPDAIPRATDAFGMRGECRSSRAAAAIRDRCWHAQPVRL